MSATSFRMPLTLTVGVTGHRAVGAPEAVGRQLDALFQQIKLALTVSASPSVARGPTMTRSLRILSPLAEGADRLFADAGLACGATLHCVLPFDRAEYAKDFETQASRDTFDRLLGQAERVLELGGDPQQRDDAYLETGRLVLQHCDLLVAIWDGQMGRGLGGTAQIVAEAMRQGALVVALDPNGLTPVVLLTGPAHHPERTDISLLTERLATLLTPPRLDRHAGRDVRTLRAVEFAMFAAERHKPYGPSEAGSKAWAHLFPADPRLAPICAPCVDGPAADVFLRSDALAKRYSLLYRGAFVANFFLSALAVTAALLALQHPGLWNRVMELFIIALIIVMTNWANQAQWHQRWIEYRHLAERLRPLRFLFPLALGLPKPHMSRAAHSQDHPSAWIDWLVRRIEIALGFPTARIDPAYLAALKTFTSTRVLDDQIDYHRRNANRMEVTETVLQKVGFALFMFTSVFCALEISEFVWGRFGSRSPVLAFMEVYNPYLTLASGVAPAVGAALLGIRYVGEFQRLQSRSDAMVSAFEHVKAAMDRDRDVANTRHRLSAHLELAAIQMMSETADWRTLVIARRIELPG